MKKFLILFCFILILFACDRFEHEIYENAEIEATFNEFSEIVQSMNADSIQIVMKFYNDDYLNDAFYKADIQAQFLGYINEYENLSVVLNSYYKDLSIQWSLYGIPANEKNIEEIAAFSDILIKTNSGYEFYGNQNKPPDYDPSKPMVVAQFSTSTNCGNCPEGAENLAELKRSYGGQFIYLEYVFDGPEPTNIFIPFAQYYGIYSNPTVVFQGQFIIEGSDAESYFTRYEQAAEAEKLISINLENIEVNGNSVSGTAIIVDLENIPISDLKLETALILKISDYEYNNVHQKLHNVVFATGTFAIENSEIDFSIDSTIEITEEALLVVWVQTKDDPYDPQTCKIYDAKTYELVNKFGGNK